MAVVVGGRAEIRGLTEAVLLLDSHGAVHIDAVVVSVQIQQAPVQLLATATSALDWNLVRDHKLRHVACVCSELEILLSVVVPMLKADPTSAVGGRLLNRYGWSVRRLARRVDGVDGPFFAVAAQETNFFRRHAMHLHTSTRSVAWLSANVDEVEAKLLGLQRLVVVIPDVDEEPHDDNGDGSGGGGGGDDDEEAGRREEDEADGDK